jgi:D-lactate dehydrogenase
MTITATVTTMTPATTSASASIKVAVFSAQTYDQVGFAALRAIDSTTLAPTEAPITDTRHIQWHYFTERLNSHSVHLAAGMDIVCCFVNDDLSASVLDELKQLGIRGIVLRCAGFNNVDAKHAKSLALPVLRVPAYSPEAVAEHTIGLILCLNRRLHKAYNRVRDDNFSLNGLLGFNLHGKTVGLIGTGRIGLATARILQGFGCHILAHDPHPIAADTLPPTLQLRYVSLEALYQQSDIISLHCPLTPQTHYLINDIAIQQMKTGVMLVNTSRGALIDTKAVIAGLKQKKIGYLALDVYEQEADLFFQDLSNEMITDEIFQRLLTFPNVLITGHQAFFTAEALQQICQITRENVMAIASACADSDHAHQIPCP